MGYTLEADKGMKYNLYIYKNMWYYKATENVYKIGTVFIRFLQWDKMGIVLCSDSDIQKQGNWRKQESGLEQEYTKQMRMYYTQVKVYILCNT